MKKFISLVLALVMALSLTTVAWGATTITVGATGCNYTTLAEAVANANDGDTIKLENGDYELRFTNNTAFNVDGLTIIGLGEDVNLAISSSEVWYGRIQGNNVVFENITFTTNTVGATGKATYNNCTFAGRLECASSGDAETYAYNCVIGEVHTSTDFDAGAAHFTNCDIEGAEYNAKATMTFTGCSIGEINILGGNTVLNNCTIDPEEISYVGSGVAGTIVMDGSFLVSTAAELITAMKNVTSGATIKLLKDITISEDWHSTNNGAKFTVPVTIDGNGKTLKLTGKVTEPNYNAVFRFEGATATVKNLTIDASAATGIQRGITSKLSIVVENCNLIGNGTGYGVIFGEGAGSAIGDVTATITNSTFTNWKTGVSDNANGQDAESVTITGSTFDNSSVNVSASETVTFTGNTVDDGSVIIHTYTANSDLAVTATGNTLDADEVNKIKAETITTDTNDFAITGTLTAPAGYQVLKTTTGTYVVVPAVALGDKFDLYQADAGMATALKLKAPTVAGLSFTEVAAKTNKDGSGNVAYIAANNGQFFVKTTNPTVSDYAVTDAGKNTVLYYVTVAGTSAANFEYAEAVSSFTKFSTYAKCDYVTGTPVAGETYFMAADGNVYMAAAAGTGTNYLLNGKVVSGVYAGVPETHTFTLNGYKYDATLKQNVPVSALCTKCMMSTGSIYLTTKVPATYTLYPTTGEGSNLYTVALPGAAAVVTPSTPAGDKVESAETFDAGIAMYVGMSIMAAAGSAVVLKKKD